MRLFGEIFKSFKRLGGESAGELFSASRYTVLVGYGGYFQGVKTVAEFSPERLVLMMKSGVFEVIGKDFVVEKYCDGDLRLSGEIEEVVRVSGERGGR